jgi:hypothetical protein
MVALDAKYHNTVGFSTRTPNCREHKREQYACKRTMSHSRSSSTEKKAIETCFFGGKKNAVDDSLRNAATFQVDRRVRTCATLLGDTELLSCLSGGDMIALVAQYHP